MFKSNKKRRALCCAMIHVQMNIIAQNIPKNRSKWVKNWLINKQKFSHIPLLKELRDNEANDFKNYLRMDANTYDHLLSLVQEGLTKQNTIMRECIGPEERLIATLRFLATGRSYEDLKYSVGIAAQTLGYIIPETCSVIFDVLKKDYMQFPKSTEEWQEISSEFESRWQFINCGGAIDGKHIKIVPPPGTGALYYNYKNFYSVVLMAIVNAKYEFIYVDVGKQGRMSDGGALEWTSFYKNLTENKLNFPTNDITKEHLNFVLIGDAAFALQEHILKPYPQKDLTYERKIFNYRVSRARNVVENTFGLLAARFRVFHTSLAVKPENINIIVLAACVLHNFLRKNSTTYVTNSTFDKENAITHETEGGDWRQNNNAELVPLAAQPRRNPSLEAKMNRQQYCDYFNGVGKVEWQDKMITAGKA